MVFSDNFGASSIIDLNENVRFNYDNLREWRQDEERNKSKHPSRLLSKPTQTAHRSTVLFIVGYAASH